MLLLPDDRLTQRREATAPGGPLGPLLESLERELDPVVASPPAVPAEKAVLSRAGGRCERCGTALTFDPRSPDTHGCPACGRVHSGPLHRCAWVMPYQMWLAERVVHGALLYLLRGREAHATFARGVLASYADRYPTWPNRDNVLGPSRPFFSTYLESIWLLQICVATDLLERGGDAATGARVRERIVEPSRALIAGYDEGMSNRQVWNNAALLAAAHLLGDRRAADTLVHGASGLLAHLSRALLADGTWYEGENYHQFALRGLWYGVTMLEAQGGALPRDLADRFQRAFSAPFVTALPDFTMPSRKDSQYAVPLRQWRMAELTELGFARRPDPLLGGALARMYDGSIEPADTGRSRSTADVERNGPRTRLTRADLGWRALLHARPELPRLEPVEPRSALLESQGYAVFRRENGVYVGVEFGQSGGGHGHPDRLNLTLYQGAIRWLDDLGTGSYVDPSLHWYRSTLAHNAPLVNGSSQPLSDGTLLAWDEREGLGWILAELLLPEEGVRLERAIVVAPDYLVDELRWNAERDVRVDLPWHLPLVPVADPVPATLDGGSRPEDGFSYLADVATIGSPHLPRVLAVADGGTLVLRPEPGPERRTAFFATGPGQPPEDRRPLVVWRLGGRAGAVRTIVSWGIAGVEGDRIVVGPQEHHTHRRDAAGWHVDLVVGEARSSVDLAGFRAPPSPAPRDTPATTVSHRLRPLRRLPDRLAGVREEGGGGVLLFELGESHYRRSEESWREAGAPTAIVGVAASDLAVRIFLDVRAGDPLFAPADAANPYDNEHPDTMRAGVQLYYALDGAVRAWMLVPEPNSEHVRLRHITGPVTPAPAARWRRTPTGYEVRIDIPLDPSRTAGAEPRVALDLLINETVAGRERRRGQLVLSGARGEFVYLKGDRHDAGRLIPLVIGA